MPSYHEVYPEKWLKPEHLGGKARVVTITRVFLEPIFNPQTRKQEQRLAASLSNTDKLLAINKTNAAEIEKITGTDDYDFWSGTRIRLSPGRAHNGKATILISEVPVSQQPTPVPAESVVHGRPQEAPVHGREGSTVHGQQEAERPLMHGREGAAAVEEFSSAIADPKSAGDRKQPSESNGDEVFFSPADLAALIRKLNQESAEPMTEKQMDYIKDQLARFSGKSVEDAHKMLEVLVGREITASNPPGVQVGKFLYDILRADSTNPTMTEVLRNFCSRPLK